MKSLDTNNIKTNVKLFLIALIITLAACINCDAQTIKPHAIPYSFKANHYSLTALTADQFYTYNLVRVITVQSGKTVIKISTMDLDYVYSKLPSYQQWMINFHSDLVKNNDVADNIIAIMAGRKQSVKILASVK